MPRQPIAPPTRPTQRTYRAAPSQPAGIAADFDLALNNRLTNIHYRSPQRANPQRTYPRPKAPPTSIGQSGESAIDAILSSCTQNFQITPTAQNPDLFEVRVIQHQNGTEIPLADAGSGIAQILPTLTLCHYAPPGATVILNQPETHLHPNAQSAPNLLTIDCANTIIPTRFSREADYDATPLGGAR